MNTVMILAMVTGLFENRTIEEVISGIVGLFVMAGVAAIILLFLLGIVTNNRVYDWLDRWKR